jgi:hypothetical protein
MAVRVQFTSAKSGDYRGRMHTRVTGGSSAVCVPTPEAHPVVASFAQNFAALPAGPDFGGSPDWRLIHHDLPFNPGDPNNTYPNIATIRINGTLQSNRPTADGSLSVGGIYLPAPDANNWHIKAIWGTDHRDAGTDAPSMILAGPISQQVPADPNPHINTLNMWVWDCQRTSGANPPGADATYRFTLGRWNSGVFSSVAANFNTAAGAFGPGHEWSLRILCNNGNGVTRCTVQGLIDGVVVRQGTSELFKPAGRPGIGNMYDQLPCCLIFSDFCNASSWAADQLAG